MRINFNYLSKYRNALLGMAIIEIVIFHYCADCVTTVPYLGSQIVLKLAKVYVSVLGSVGVDFFVLLSGIGLYYSFSQNSDIKEFYRKRFNRIIPTYLFLGGILWLIRDIFVMGEPFSTFFRDLTMVSFWCEGNTLVWYISFCILVYTFFPFLYKAINNSAEYRIFRLLGLIGLIVVIVIFSYCYKVDGINRLEIAIERIPLFLIGIFIGDYVKNKKVLSIKNCIVMIVLFVVIFVISEIFFAGFLNRFAIGIYAFLLIMFLAFLFEKILSKSKTLINILDVFGKYSLGIYLSHVMIRDIFKQRGAHTEKLGVYFLVIILSIVFSIIEAKIRTRFLDKGKI